MNTEEALRQAVEQASLRWADQKDNLILACIVAHDITSPFDLVLCEQRTLTETRVWAEPMNPKVRDTRIAALNEENALLRAEIVRLAALVPASERT